MEAGVGPAFLRSGRGDGSRPSFLSEGVDPRPQTRCGGVSARPSLAGEVVVADIDTSTAEALYCYKHSGRETHVRCSSCDRPLCPDCMVYSPVSYTHLRAHETDSYLVCRLLLEKKKNKRTKSV